MALEKVTVLSFEMAMAGCTYYVSKSAILDVFCLARTGRSIPRNKCNLNHQSDDYNMISPYSCGLVSIS